MFKTRQKRNKAMLVLTGLISAGAAYFAVTLLFKLPIVADLLGVKPDMHKLIVGMADEVNKNYPMMADSITRIDKFIPEDGNAFSYRMTILADISPSDINALKFHETINAKYCASPELKRFRDAGTKISWIYYNKEDQYLTKVTMTPDLCK